MIDIEALKKKQADELNAAIEHNNGIEEFNKLGLPSCIHGCLKDGVFLVKGDRLKDHTTRECARAILNSIEIGWSYEYKFADGHTEKSIACVELEHRFGFCSIKPYDVLTIKYNAFLGGKEALVSFSMSIQESLMDLIGTCFRKSSRPISEFPFHSFDVKEYHNVREVPVIDFGFSSRCHSSGERFLVESDSINKLFDAIIQEDNGTQTRETKEHQPD